MSYVPECVDEEQMQSIQLQQQQQLVERSKSSHSSRLSLKMQPLVGDQSKAESLDGTNSESRRSKDKTKDELYGRSGDFHIVQQEEEKKASNKMTDGQKMSSQQDSKQELSSQLNSNASLQNMMMLQNSMKEPKFMMVDPNAGKEIRTNPDVKKHSSLLQPSEKVMQKFSLFRNKGQQ